MAQLSARGAHFIGRFEGWRDKPYNDAANNATIGFGHLIHMGPVTPHDVSEWGTITMDHGIQLLQSDASIAETAIDHYITRPLAQCERDALASFAFNCGGGALAGSVGKAVNAKQDPTPYLEQWDHAGHRVLEGLRTRRKGEAALFTTGDYGDGEPPLPPKAAAAKAKKAKPAAAADRGAEAGPTTGRGCGSSGSSAAPGTRDTPAIRTCASRPARPRPFRPGRGRS